MGREVAEELNPAVGLVVVQVVSAGVNMFYKLAIVDGFNMHILVAYRNLFATTTFCPLAYFLERKRRPRLTWMILMWAFLNGLFGSTMAMNLYILTINLTSATFASAMANLIPAFTFILSVAFRLKSLGIRKASGKAKVAGTVLGIGGAMLLTFYEGAEVDIWSTNIDLLKNHNQGVDHNTIASPHKESFNHVMGSLSSVAAGLAFSLWGIVQAKMGEAFPCPYSSTALIALMASLQSTAFAVCMERDWSQWRMGFNIRLLSATYSGIAVIVAIMGSLLLQEKLHMGTIFGSVLIIIGLFVVLLGKGRELAKVAELHEGSSAVHDASKWENKKEGWKLEQRR